MHTKSTCCDYTATGIIHGSCKNKTLYVYSEQPPTPTPKPTGPGLVPEGEILEQSPTPKPTGPAALPDGGVAVQPPTTPTQPPLFGRNDATVPLQGGGFFGQPTATTTPVPTPPSFGQKAPEGQVLSSPGAGVAPRIIQPPTPTCTPGTVLDPDINECVLENPPQFCPDGSVPKSTGPGGIRPECPTSFEAEQPEAEEPDQPETQQPETQQPQDDEEVEPPNEDEGQDTTAGTLT